MKIILTNLFALLFIASTVFAQAPQGMNYQAVARDASGNILPSQNISIRFTITDGNGGATLYQETHTVSTNQFGLFILNIGNGTPTSGTFSSVTWSSITPWLAVEMDPAGGTAYISMGSSQLLSVPYALFAASGNQGPQGTPGPQGVQGLQGPIGATGSTGSTGPQGPQGATGAAGATGMQGLQGATGATGAQGPAGLNGDRYTTSSSTSLTIGVGTQNLTVGTGLNYATGQTVIIANTASNLMTGTVVTYNSLTGAMVATVTSITGSGTFISWNVSLNGAPGPAGPVGVVGPTGATGPAGANGAIWYTGAGVPAGAMGAVNDMYLNTANGDYYKKTGISTWTLQANLSGPQGIQGAVGAVVRGKGAFEDERL